MENFFSIRRYNAIQRLPLNRERCPSVGRSTGKWMIAKKSTGDTVGYAISEQGGSPFTHAWRYPFCGTGDSGS
jgi:hypothetical protein